MLERTFRSCFPSEVEVFNTSRAASGLAAGDSIDATILDNVRDAAAVVWLATPAAVRRSFWMAWELGVATAFGRFVIPVRCLGLSTTSLPLLQGGRYAPDIGERDGMQTLLTTLRTKLDLQENRIAETLTTVFDRASEPNPLWGTLDEGSLQVRMLGHRLLVENRSGSDLTIIDATTADSTGRDGALDAVWRPLRQLAARERRIIDAPPTWDGSAPPEIRVKWEVSDGGRFWSQIPVLSE
ncbi:hypothetical protein Cwoe_2262 [Conexibacter woesei DSM 14684]|uniref:TIR domain-containing protein n=2 Tax=Conexibacter TaxID=191494 RepID=D3F6C0_CONWI|nr:hypothetical protein Cwoe_2262 [Conexibacter woesei DSM 14684]